MSSRHNAGHSLVRRLRSAALHAAIALLIVPATPSVAAEVLNVALNADIRGLNPGVSRDDNTDNVIHHIVESLVAYDANLRVAPLLADSWIVSDDGRTYTFKLRREIVFQNGAPMTSAEVRWSWERYLDPETGWGCRRWFDGSAEDGEGGLHVLGIETPDPFTVVFRLDRPSALFLPQLANIQCPSAVLHPDSVAPDRSFKHPVGTGPFQLAQWRRGEFIELKRFAGYRPRPEPRSGYAGARIARVERVRFVIVPEAVSTLAALRSGSIDVAPRVSADALTELRGNPALRVHDQSLLGWTVLLLNTRDPVLKDVRMRRALAHAIGRKQIVAVNTGGLARVSSSAVPVGSDYRTAVHETWHAYDPKEARRLLAEAGYRGEPIRIQTNRRYKNMFDNAIVVQAMLHAAGVNAQLDVMDWAAQLARYQAGKFQISSFSYSGRLDPALTYSNLIGDKDERPTAQWEDAAAAELRAQLMTQIDPNERRRTMEALHQRMVAQVPIIGLYNGHAATVSRAEVHDLRTWAAGTTALWGVAKGTPAAAAAKR